jgi:hypothetical protein
LVGNRFPARAGRRSDIYASSVVALVMDKAAKANMPKAAS